MRRAFFAFLILFLAPGTARAQSNPVQIENQLPGSTGWDINKAKVGTDAVGQIKGYASATSVNKGENITFHVSVNPAQAYTIDVYRIGWYGGVGGRLLQHVGPLSGTQQPACPMDPVTGMIECHWAAAYTLATQTTWTSGVYFAVLTNEQGFKNHMIFVVRDDSRIASLLYQQGVTTYQAYNSYPNDGVTGKSLYDFNSFGQVLASTGWHSSAKVSFDRPYQDVGIMSGVYSDFGEVNFIRFIERFGFDVAYATDVDTHESPQRLLNYRGFLSVGHDEYWSKPMYDGAIAARDAGVNLGFFGSNAVYWQIRFESSTTGVANRVVVCYKNRFLDPLADPTLKTILWRDPFLGRPEQTLIGVQSLTTLPAKNPGDLVVMNTGSWVWTGTGFVDGETAKELVGYEADHFDPAFPAPNAVPGTFTLLSRSPWGPGPNDFANASVYQAPSGAWVFATGTMDWNWALDSYQHGQTRTDTRVQRATKNVLNRFISARVTSPAPGSVLNATSATFTWSAVPGATAYWLDVGTGSSGPNDLFEQGVSLATSQTVSGIPILGNTIRARLWTQFGGIWVFDERTYTTFNARASITSPASGSVLPGASVTFNWNSVAGASGYHLEVGTSAGGHNLFGQPVGLATSQTVNGLPILGGTIYARLWTQYNGRWYFGDSTYSALNAKAVMQSPAPGSALPGASTTFHWSASTSVLAYYLEVGTGPGKHDLFGQDVGLATSRTVNNLPILGGTVYVRLWTQLGGGGWYFNDYTYSAVNAKAAMQLPAPGSGLGGPSVTFTWNAGPGASTYWLDVGTTAGGHNLFGQSVGLATSQTVSGLPVLGNPIYVRLWSQVGGRWYFDDYTYTAVNAKAVMLSPAPSSVLHGGVAAFSWSAGTGAAQYWLEVGTAPGSHNIFGQSVGLAMSRIVGDFPPPGTPIYVRLWTLVGSAWYFSDYTYTAGSVE